MEKNNEVKQVRCAIYTRKSTTEGLEKDFTSLDVQRESSTSYIQSQKHLGWIILPEKYDDGGFSGATTDRPALQRLLEDIKQKKIDCIAVYKIDRLSRSLRDFVNLLQFFEEQQITFVSVTQNFSTTSSMGRLTLNILLSFSQFERELISERTRDKMGAARMRGKWVGGRPGLGYDADRVTRKLVINHNEAELIREIFKLYLEKKSLLEVAKTLNERGLRTKECRRKVKTVGGVPFKNTNIQIILKNVTYLGKVSYGNKIYPGEHEAIISEELFNQAQVIMKQNTHERGVSKNRKFQGILSGILRCAPCNASMCHGYATKNNYKYRYYTCLNAIKRNRKDCPIKSVSALVIEAKCLTLLRETTKAEALQESSWQTLTLEEQIKAIQSLVKYIEYDGNKGKLVIQLKDGDKKYEFDVPLEQLKKIACKPKNEFFSEPPIRRFLLLAHQIKNMLAENRAKDLNQLADWTSTSKSRLEQIMNFLFLSPKIQEEIICGDINRISQVSEYSMRSISNEPDWEKQLSTWNHLILPT